MTARSPYPLYDARMGDALAFAAERFCRQTRKGSSTPYLSHLLSVSALVMEHGGTTDQAIAAVLHDYLEDIPGASYDEVRERFGVVVADIVRGLSDTEDAEHKGPWRDRKEAFLRRLATEPEEVRLVCAADKLHNASTLLREVRERGDEAFARFRGKKDGTLWYQREALRVLRNGFDHPILDAFEEVIAAIEEASSDPMSLVSADAPHAHKTV
jgi:(p)ppGpp synthase/HD superfamily hydrolase